MTPLAPPPPPRSPLLRASSGGSPRLPLYSSGRGSGDSLSVEDEPEPRFSGASCVGWWRLGCSASHLSLSHGRPCSSPLLLTSHARLAVCGSIAPALDTIREASSQPGTLGTEGAAPPPPACPAAQPAGAAATLDAVLELLGGGTAAASPAGSGEEEAHQRAPDAEAVEDPRVERAAPAGPSLTAEVAAEAAALAGILALLGSPGEAALTVVGGAADGLEGGSDLGAEVALLLRSGGPPREAGPVSTPTPSSAAASPGPWPAAGLSGRPASVGPGCDSADGLSASAPGAAQGACWLGGPPSCGGEQGLYLAEPGEPALAPWMDAAHVKPAPPPGSAAVEAAITSAATGRHAWAARQLPPWGDEEGGRVGGRLPAMYARQMRERQEAEKRWVAGDPAWPLVATAPLLLHSPVPLPLPLPACEGPLQCPSPGTIAGSFCLAEAAEVLLPSSAAGMPRSASSRRRQTCRAAPSARRSARPPPPAAPPPPQPPNTSSLALPPAADALGRRLGAGCTRGSGRSGSGRCRGVWVPRRAGCRASSEPEPECRAVVLPPTTSAAAAEGRPCRQARSEPHQPCCWEGCWERCETRVRYCPACPGPPSRRCAALREQQEQQALSGCTFSPSIDPRSAALARQGVRYGTGGSRTATAASCSGLDEAVLLQLQALHGAGLNALAAADLLVAAGAAQTGCAGTGLGNGGGENAAGQPPMDAPGDAAASSDAVTAASSLSSAAEGGAAGQPGPRRSDPASALAGACLPAAVLSPGAAQARREPAAGPGAARLASRGLNSVLRASDRLYAHALNMQARQRQAPLELQHVRRSLPACCCPAAGCGAATCWLWCTAPDRRSNVLEKGALDPCLCVPHPTAPNLLSSLFVVPPPSAEVAAGGGGCLPKGPPLPWPDAQPRRQPAAVPPLAAAVAPSQRAAGAAGGAGEAARKPYRIVLAAVRAAPRLRSGCFPGQAGALCAGDAGRQGGAPRSLRVGSRAGTVRC